VAAGTNKARCLCAVEGLTSRAVDRPDKRQAGRGYESAQVLRPNVDKKELGVRSDSRAVSKCAAMGVHEVL
jgi:hypothetical protein